MDNRWSIVIGGLVLWYFYQKQMGSRALQFTEVYPGDNELDSTEPSLISAVIENFQPEITAMNKNREAFLAMLRASEGTSKYENPYAVIFGGVEMENFDFSDHPANLGFTDWVYFNDSKGFRTFSTASGAYQILAKTWNRLKLKLGLKDFSKESQDLAALELIREKGALDDVDSGDAVSAAKKVSSVWASLPGAPYGQPTKSVEFVVSTFNSALAA